MITIIRFQNLHFEFMAETDYNKKHPVFKIPGKKNKSNIVPVYDDALDNFLKWLAEVVIQIYKSPRSLLYRSPRSSPVKNNQKTSRNIQNFHQQLSENRPHNIYFPKRLILT